LLHLITAFAIWTFEMDDLLGLDLKGNQEQPKFPTSTLPTLRQSRTPSTSGRSTPNILRPSSTSNSQPSIKIGSKPATPANDSFANLLGGTSKQTNNLSLQERQRRFQEEKAKKEAEDRKRLESQFGSQHEDFWNGFGAAPNGQNVAVSPPALNSHVRKNPLGSKVSPSFGNDDDDILAAFNSSAPVNSSSHFPPSESHPRQDLNQTRVQPGKTSTGNGEMNFGDDDDDDDPFGLHQLTQKQNASQTSQMVNDDDDILGMLGRPVEEVASIKTTPATNDKPQSREDPVLINPHDKAVAELVDMGFPSEKAAIALAATDSGSDVRAAVGILLNQAHEESRQKVQGKTDMVEPNLVQTSRRSRDPESTRGNNADESIPTWMRNQEDSSRSNSQVRNQMSGKEKDVTQVASEIGSSIFKSANSLWKSSQKKVQRAMADLQQDGDSNQPKWMRDAQSTDNSQTRRELPDRKASAKAPMQANMTDEAMMLESGDIQPSPASRPLPAHDVGMQDSSRERRSTPIDRKTSSSPALSTSSRPASRLTRQDLEADNSDGYISPARRRKPQSTLHEPSLSDAIHPTLPMRGKSPLSSAPLQSNNPFASVASKSKQSTPSTRPKVPPRQIPPASSAAMSTSASHRQSGSEAFKRGDYASAQAAYTKALQPLPSNHPIMIVIFCNRALTNIKVGDPKAAVFDADSALEIIGISKGDGEKINLGTREGEKDMKEFYGKALMRKAEALEHMEKWSEAAKMWQEAVEAGLGGSVSMQGRNRCERAAGGGSTSLAQANRSGIPKSSPKPAPKPKSSAFGGRTVTRPTDTHAASAAAVRKLRAANAAAEKADDEKYALTDLVDAKLIIWKGTKADNLRALLGSLDKVLWDGAGWAKVGMQDLVMPNRVKIIYMKAIAKVHPDKVKRPSPKLSPLTN
jgi:hypothetical protein